MSHVLILSLVFPPDSVSTAQLMADLAVDLKNSGHQVTVLTTCPHYNRSTENEQNQPLHARWGGLLWQSDYNGIPVYHACMPKKSGSKVLRILAWLHFHFLSTIAGILLVKKPQIIIAPSPPLTIGLSAWILARFHRMPFVYNVQEIYPDIAIRLGAIHNSFLINILYRLEHFVYRRAARITVIAPNMAARLRQKGVPAGKIAVIPNFVDVDLFCPLNKDNYFSRRHKVQDKFVVSYAGNMGPVQGLEHFIEAADLLRSEPQIAFMMMGNGTLQADLLRQAQRLALPNLVWLPYQPYALMPQIYAASDLSLVSMAPATGGEAAPSKAYRIMACARPLLAAADHDSDLANLARDERCGIVVSPGSARALADAILKASREPDSLDEMGRRGREYVANHCARPVITGKYDALIRELS